MRYRSLVPRLLLTVVTLVVVAAPLGAQDTRTRRPGPQDRQEMERRIRAQMGRMIRAELGLTQEQYEPVAVVMERFLEERRSLWRRERELRRNVQAYVEDGTADPARARELLEQMRELRDLEAAIFDDEQEALLETLTPTQVLQLHTLRESISRRVRDLRRRRGGPGDGIEGGWSTHGMLERPLRPGVDLAPGRASG